METRIKEKKEIAPDVFHIVLDHKLDFKPGQYISLKFFENGLPIVRPYSIASLPGEDIELCIALVEGGKFSDHLKVLNEGDNIEFLGPFGKFVLEGDPKDVTFIAGGTGITALRSMIKTLLKKGADVRLFFGFRTPEYYLFREDFEKMVNEYENFSLIPAISRPEETTNEWSGEVGRLNEVLPKYARKGREYYICGHGSFIDSIVTTLFDLGILEENIHKEAWS